MQGTLAPLTTLLVLSATPFAARADWTLGAGASLSYDDNVGNAGSYTSQVAAYAAAANLSLFQLIPLGGDFTLALGGDLAGELYDQLPGLRNASIDGSVSLKRKWGLGAFAPWARAQISLGREEYEDGYRDATITRASLEFGKRIDERWNLAMKYVFERRAATAGAQVEPGISSDAFSQQGHSLIATAQYSLSERISLNLSSLARYGDVVSTILTPGNDVYDSASAIAKDPAFGPYAYAYRLTGTSYGLRLGAEFAISAHSVIGCDYQRLETQARGGNDYSNSTPEITWNYRY